VGKNRLLRWSVVGRGNIFYTSGFKLSSAQARWRIFDRNDKGKEPLCLPNPCPKTCWEELGKEEKNWIPDSPPRRGE